MRRGECNITHGGYKTRLYRIWKQMRIRCRCVTNPTYQYYGARGISICPEWEDFATFRAWALSHGYTDQLSIERIDNDGDYCPENCTWIPRGDQNKNTRHVKTYTHDGITLHHNEWAERIGISPPTLTRRIAMHGVDIALSMPKQNRGGRHQRTPWNIAVG